MKEQDLTVFLSNWTILSLKKPLQFLLTVSSEERISYRFKKIIETTDEIR